MEVLERVRTKKYNAVYNFLLNKSVRSYVAKRILREWNEVNCQASRRNAGRRSFDKKFLYIPQDLALKFAEASFFESGFK